MQKEAISPQWEYKVITLNINEGDFRTEQYLNTIGNERWELCSVFTMPPPYSSEIKALFKRSKNCATL